MNKDNLIAYIKNQKSPQPKNPYWSFDEKTKTITGFTKNELPKYQALFETVTGHFKDVFINHKTECQVLVLEQTILDKIDQSLKSTLNHLGSFLIDQKELVLVSPPQENSYFKAVVDEDFWFKTFTKKKVFPYMRIHSHCDFLAYQSKTDYSSLNSGTLEIVLGNVTHSTPSIAWWFDDGKTAKDRVFHQQLDHPETYHVKEPNKS